MITKFKNGNILFSVTRDLKSGYYDKDNIDNFYFDECFMNDIQWTYIDGVPYFIDTNTGLVYDTMYYDIRQFIDHMLKNGKMRLYPYSKEISHELFSKYLDNITLV